MKISHHNSWHERLKTFLYQRAHTSFGLPQKAEIGSMIWKLQNGTFLPNVRGILWQSCPQTGMDHRLGLRFQCRAWNVFDQSYSREILAMSGDLFHWTSKGHSNFMNLWFWCFQILYVFLNEIYFKIPTNQQEGLYFISLYR